MSNRIMKKKIPYVDQFESIEDAFNYLAKELNASILRSSSSNSSSSDTIQLAEGELKSFSFTYTAGGPVQAVSATVSHSLGVVPRAVLYAGQVTALQVGGEDNTQNWRVSSMTSTDVTIQLMMLSGTRVHNFFILK